MAILLVHLRVQDYDKWRPVFEGEAGTRQRFGCSGTHIFTNAHDRNELIINLQWDTEDNAKRFLQSDELKQAMQRAGVMGPPETWFLEDAGRTPS